MVSRLRTDPVLALAVVLGSITALAVLVGAVLIVRHWLDIQSSSAGEAAAFIVSDYGASNAQCRGVGPDQWSCGVTYRGCSVHGVIDYDGPGSYLWNGRNPLAACPGYRGP